MDAIAKELRDAWELKQKYFSSPELATQLQQAIDRVAATLKSGGKVLFCGNGGSAADAQHLAAELVCRFVLDRPALPAIALSTDTSLMTAIGNDMGFERLFSRQVEAHGRKGDILVAISTSGRSPNVLKAIEAARQLGLYVIGMTSERDEAMSPQCDLSFRVPSRDTGRIQECHITIGHILCGAVERKLYT